jgi:hypothetical protein
MMWWKSQSRTGPLNRDLFVSPLSDDEERITPDSIVGWRLNEMLPLSGKPAGEKGRPEDGVVSSRQ